MRNIEEAKELDRRVRIQTPYVATKILEHLKGQPDEWYSLALLLDDITPTYIFVHNGFWQSTKDFKVRTPIFRHKFFEELCMQIAYSCAALEIQLALDLYKAEFESDVSSVSPDILGDPFRMSMHMYTTHSRAGKAPIERAERAKKNALTSYKLLVKLGGDDNLTRTGRKAAKQHSQEIFDGVLLLPS